MTTIHKEGIRIILTIVTIFVILSLAVFFLIDNHIVSYVIISIFIILSIFTLYFFRNPKREPVTCDLSTIISPCDGKVVIVEEVEESEYFNRKVLQISVFMSIFNVHVNWFPVKGVVKYVKYHPGKYLVAWHPKSSVLNERTTVVIQNGENEVLVRQIAGLVARRIVCYANEGMDSSPEKQIGFIKFGSRMDIFLPLDTKVHIKPGDTVVGSQTLLATIN